MVKSKAHRDATRDIFHHIFGFNLPPKIKDRLFTTDKVEVTIHPRSSKGEPVDLNVTQFDTTLQGRTIDVREYVLSWGDQARNDDLLKYRSERVPEGRYNRRADSRREFAPGELIIDQRDIEWIDISVDYQARAALRNRIDASA